jgi:hypothetical protein
MLARKPKSRASPDEEESARSPIAIRLPVREHGWIVLRQRKRKIQPLIGVKGACPLGLPPPLGGEWGSPSQFPRQLKNSWGFLQSPDFENFHSGKKPKAVSEQTFILSSNEYAVYLLPVRAEGGWND